MKTYSAKASEIERKWHVIDASGQTLGRLASEVAQLLKGKTKPQYTPSMDVGDFVIIVNARKIHMTGRKLSQKTYYRHSQYPSGLRAVKLERMLQIRPERVLEHAVRGMVPHNKLGDAMMRKLKVYADETHPHAAQITGQTKREQKLAQQGTQANVAPAAVPGEEA